MIRRLALTASLLLAAGAHAQTVTPDSALPTASSVSGTDYLRLTQGHAGTFATRKVPVGTLLNSLTAGNVSSALGFAPTSSADVSNAIASANLSYSVPLTSKGAANGVATLGADAKLPDALLHPVLSSPGTYGGSGLCVVPTIDGYGRVTNITTTACSGGGGSGTTDASALTTGTLSNARLSSSAVSYLLGANPLLPANNLSEVASKPAALMNLNASSMASVLSADAQQAYTDNVNHWWNATANIGGTNYTHIVPTDGGYTTVNFGMALPSSYTPVQGSMWQAEVWMHTLYEECKRAGRTDACNKISTQWTYWKALYSTNTATNGLGSDGSADGTINSSDDGWLKMDTLFEIYDVTGDSAALSYIQAAEPRILARFRDPNTTPTTHGTLTYSPYGETYYLPASCNPTHACTSSMFEEENALALLSLYTKAGNTPAEYLTYAQDVWAWTNNYLKTSAFNGILYVELDIGTPGGAHYLKPLNDYYGAPQQGLSANTLEGTMQHALLGARLYAVTGTSSYLTGVQAMATALINQYIEPNGVFLNDRDTFVEAHWFPDCVSEVLPILTTSQAATLRAAILATSKSIADQRLPTGHYSGDWSGPRALPNGLGYTTWSSEAMMCLTCSVPEGNPYTLMINATSENAILGGALAAGASSIPSAPSLSTLAATAGLPPAIQSYAALSPANQALISGAVQRAGDAIPGDLCADFTGQQGYACLRGGSTTSTGYLNLYTSDGVQRGFVGGYVSGSSPDIQLEGLNGAKIWLGPAVGINCDPGSTYGLYVCPNAYFGGTVTLGQSLSVTGQTSLGASTYVNGHQMNQLEGSNTGGAYSLGSGDVLITVGVTGAAPGDYAVCSTTITGVDYQITGVVETANVVRCAEHNPNPTSGNLSMPAHTIYARVTKRT